MFIQSDPKVMVRQAVVNKGLEKKVSMFRKHCLISFLTRSTVSSLIFFSFLISFLTRSTVSSLIFLNQWLCHKVGLPDPQAYF